MPEKSAYHAQPSHSAHSQQCTVHSELKSQCTLCTLNAQSQCTVQLSQSSQCTSHKTQCTHVTVHSHTACSAQSYCNVQCHIHHSAWSQSNVNCSTLQEKQGRFLAGFWDCVHSALCPVQCIVQCSVYYTQSVHKSKVLQFVAVQQTIMVRDSADRHRPDWEGHSRDKILKRKIREMFPIIFSGNVSRGYT